MTDPEQEGFVLHWGYVALVAILLFAASAIWVTAGWRWLWLAPAVVVGLILLNFVVVLFEDRWVMVTVDDIVLGAPGTCRECDHGLDILRKTRTFKVRCPICGHRESGVFH